MQLNPTSCPTQKKEERKRRERGENLSEQIWELNLEFPGGGVAVFVYHSADVIINVSTRPASRFGGGPVFGRLYGQKPHHAKRLKINFSMVFKNSHNI